MSINASARARAEQPKRQQRKEGGESQPRPRERILSTARELFYKHGVQSVSVDQIAAAAGTNKMTLYRHFESKDVLIAACIRTVADAFDEDWNEIASQYHGDPQGGILRLVGLDQASS